MAVICREINMRILTILIALGAASLASADAVAAMPPASNSDKAAIQALEDTYNDGFNSKDVGLLSWKGAVCL
jgi:hypothetical protein